jgi:hypothetical protein
LAAADDNSVVLIAGGPLNMIEAVMLSPADDESPLTGLQLITQKVREAWMVAGHFPVGSEWNANITTLAASSANYVALNWPTSIPVNWGVQTGDSPVVGNTLTSKPGGDLMRVGYSYPSSSGLGRPAWTQMVILCAWTQGSQFDRSQPGIASFHATTGVNDFTYSPTGNHYFWAKKLPDSIYKDQINALLAADVTADPLLPNWGSAVPIIVG